MAKFPLPPLDARGRRVKTGSRVRIIGVPKLRGMDASVRPDTEAVFRHLVGTAKRVSGFDSFGCAEIFFTIRRGRQRGMHSVAIEPFLLLVQARPPAGKRRGVAKRSARRR